VRRHDRQLGAEPVLGIDDLLRRVPLQQLLADVEVGSVGADVRGCPPVIGECRLTLSRVLAKDDAAHI
jgi:hypothetical protein